MDLCLVGHTYRRYPMEEAFKRASEFGYTHIEVRDFSDINLDAIEDISGSLERAREFSSIYKISPLIFKTIDIPEKSALNKDSLLKWIISLCDVFKRYDIKIWNTRINLINGPRSFVEATDVHINYIIDILKEIACILEKYQLLLTIENHMGNIHDSLEGIIEILSGVKSRSIRACFDFANFIIINPSENLIKGVELYSEFIGYTHLKNIKLYETNYDWGIPISFGDIDYRAILDKLSKRYNGLLGLEYCGTGDPVHFSKLDAEYIKLIINEIERG